MLHTCIYIYNVPELSALDGFAAFALLRVVLTLSLASRTLRSNHGSSNSLDIRVHVTHVHYLFTYTNVGTLILVLVGT